MQPGNKVDFRAGALFVKNGTLFAGQTDELTGGIIKGPVPFIGSVPTPLLPTFRNHLTPSIVTINSRTGHNG